MNELPADRKQQLQTLQWGALGVGVVAAVVCVLGAFLMPAAFFRAYLVAYLFFLGIGHGCLVVLMIYHLTGGAWGFLIRRFLEAGARTLPLLAVLFIPVALGVGELYPWARSEAVAANAGLQHKQIYLNVPFFLFRAALFFILWVVLAYCLTAWSRAQERSGDARWGERLYLLSGPGLVVYGVTITFASVDWVMSLQPAFRSTIFGPLFASGELLTGFSFVLLVLAWLIARLPLARVVSVEALNDLGNLLFTFLIFWAYMTFFQFMLIWIANLPYDVIWYLPRERGPWQAVVWVLFVCHFVVPFGFLLSRDVKRSPRALAALAGLLLFMHLIYLYYQVLPAFPPDAFLDHWLDFVTPLAVGGLWLTYLAWDLKEGPVLLQHDVNRAAAVHYRALDMEAQVREGEVPHA